MKIVKNQPRNRNSATSAKIEFIFYRYLNCISSISKPEPRRVDECTQEFRPFRIQNISYPTAAVEFAGFPGKIMRVPLMNNYFNPIAVLMGRTVGKLISN